MKALAGMEKHSRGGAWVVFASYVGAIVTSVAAGAWLIAQPQTGWTVAAITFLVFFIGTRLRGLNNIVHECSHATFSAHRADNTIIGSLCASLVMGCFRDYRDDHLTHHAHLGDYEHDEDLKTIKALRLDDPLTPPVVLRHVVTPLIGRHLPHYLRVNLSARDGRAYLALKVGLLVATAAITLVAPVVGLLFVVAPFALVYTAINYWTDCLDHAGIVASGDDLDASRNILAPGPLRVLLFPRHDCYHLVHHLFPHVPARHLARCHDTLLAEAAYANRTNATRKAGLPGRAPSAGPGFGSGWAGARLGRVAGYFSL
jgi:fatty acid desaturase